MDAFANRKRKNGILKFAMSTAAVASPTTFNKAKKIIIGDGYRFLLFPTAVSLHTRNPNET